MSALYVSPIIEETSSLLVSSLCAADVMAYISRDIGSASILPKDTGVCPRLEHRHPESLFNTRRLCESLFEIRCWRINRLWWIRHRPRDCELIRQTPISQPVIVAPCPGRAGTEDGCSAGRHAPVPALVGHLRVCFSLQISTLAV